MTAVQVLLVVAIVAVPVALFWGVMLLRRHLKNVTDLMRLTNETSWLAAERANRAHEAAAKVKAEVKDLKDTLQPGGGSHYELPRVPSWFVACGIVLSAAAVCVAGVQLTGGFVMPITPESVQLFDSAVQAHHDGRYAAARETYRRAAGAGYSPVYALEGVAECSFYLGDYAATLRACEDLLNTPGGAERGRYWRGNVAYKQGRFEDAVIEFQWSHRGGYSLAGRMLAHMQRAAKNG